jgi:hypothetical protein
MQQKIKIIVLITIVILSGNNLSGQYAEKPSLVNCPAEKIQVHLSHESAFTGEIIFFKIYCTSSLFPTKELSSLAFIELVSSENTSIIRKKILLKHGEGSGEFEIPDNLPTGLYYILAYTNWMKNFGEGLFFRKEIPIVNPNQSFKNSLDSLGSGMKKEETTVINTITGKLKVLPGKKKYSIREHVTMKIETGSMPGKVISGDFSVSVYRKEPPMIFNTKKSKEQVLIKEPEKIVYMPDYKGIRLSGKLADPSGNAVSGAYVTASIPGPGTDLKGSLTDSVGDFNFLLKPKNGEQEMVIILPSSEIKISLDESFWNGFRNPPDNLVFGLDQESISYLKEKFTHFQFQTRLKRQNFIKNAQVESPPDSGLFYSTPDQIIKMSDYFNLDSLREYFYELAPSVKFFTRKGELEVQVFDPVTMNYLEDKPGVFIDGVLYDYFAEINKIPVREIDHIAVIPSTYY